MNPPQRAPFPEDVMWDLIHTTAVTSGKEFFLGLSRTLAAVLNLPIVAASEVTETRGAVCTLALWTGVGWQDNLRYELEGTPCAMVHATRDLVCIERGAAARFPGDELLARFGVECYLGAPLVAASGEIIGHLCAMGPRPLVPGPNELLLLRTFAARAAAELERLRTERELTGQRAFLRQVVDINPSLIFVKDREGRFRLANQALADVYGTTVDGIVGKTDADFNPSAAEVEFFRRKDLEVMDTQRESLIPEEPVTEAGGPVRWFQTIKRPIIGADGTAQLVLGVATEITELKRAREELVERQEREHQRIQAELDRAKQELVHKTRLAVIGQVAASIAHELRNPLGAIHNAVFYLRRREAQLEPKWDQYLEIIRHEVLAADRIVNDLLEVARAKQPAKQAVDLAEAALEVFERLPHPRGVGLDVRLDPLPLVVSADPQQLRQVLANLFTNSIQALGATGHIVVRAVREPGWDVLTVSDDGPGVAPEIRERLFEPLFTTKAKGTGLGLVICRQILERHGATIELRPANRGTTFEIRLPRD